MKRFLLIRVACFVPHNCQRKKMVAVDIPFVRQSAIVINSLAEKGGRCYVAVPTYCVELYKTINI